MWHVCVNYKECWHYYSVKWSRFVQAQSGWPVPMHPPQVWANRQTEALEVPAHHRAPCFLLAWPTPSPQWCSRAKETLLSRAPLTWTAGHRATWEGTVCSHSNRHHPSSPSRITATCTTAMAWTSTMSPWPPTWQPAAWAAWARWPDRWVSRPWPQGPHPACPPWGKNRNTVDPYGVLNLNLSDQLVQGARRPFKNCTNM